MVSVKNVFYKFCFCLGLGTASYYTYAQVQHWVDGNASDSQSSQGSILQGKVQDLIKNEIIAPVQHQVARAAAIVAPSFIANPNASVDVSKIKPADAASPEASPAAVADASPSPAEGEKKEGEENKTAENAEGTPPADGAAPILPMAQPYPYMQAMMPNGMPYPQAMVPESSSAQANSENPSNGLSGPSPASTGSNDYNGAVGAGYYGSGSGNSSGNSNSGYTGNTTNNGSSGSNSGSGSSNSVLTQQDLSTLTAPVQAAFQDQQNTVNGYVCSQSSHSSCTYQNGVSVHSMRWNFDEGLKPNVNFAVKAASGSTPVQFDVSFQVQDRLMNDQTITLTAKPSEILVHNEFRDSKSYRVYEFKMPDSEVMAEDTLTKMQATLVYEVTETGMVMSPESKFSFARDQVKTSGAAWDPNAPNGEISQNELYFVADELPYSMSLQKSE